jgi:integrase
MQSRTSSTVEPRRWFEPVVKAGGLPGFTWHCLRHTFASRLVMAGVDIRTVQELLCHKTIAMTVFAPCTEAHARSRGEARRANGDANRHQGGFDNKHGRISVAASNSVG